MSDDTEKPKHHGGIIEMVRTTMLAVILGVMGWVGTTVTKLSDQSSDQKAAQSQLKQKIDDLELSIKPISDAVPAMGREVDKLDLQEADHERRISDLEQVKALRR